MFFSNTRWTQLTAPFYSILSEISICQNSLGFFSYKAWWGSRTPDKRSKTIPSSRITPDPLDPQLHDGASSLQFTHSCSTGFRSEEWPEQKHGFVLSDPFLCCFWGFCLDYCTVEDPNMAHFTYWFFYLLVFDRIHDAMCLKMSRTSSRNIGPQHQKYSSILYCTHGVLFIPVFTKPISSVCC